MSIPFPCVFFCSKGLWVLSSPDPEVFGFRGVVVRGEFVKGGEEGGPCCVCALGGYLPWFPLLPSVCFGYGSKPICPKLGEGGLGIWMGK